MNSLGFRPIMHLLLSALILCMGIMLMPQWAHADDRSYHDEVPLQPTNWNKKLSVPLFDPALGVLTKIEFVLVGQVNGTARLENLDAAPALVVAESVADLQLERPNGTFIMRVSPSATQSRQLGRFDNTLDFAGTSGATITDIVGIAVSENVVYTDAANLSLFTGIGNIELGIRSTGRSQATGAGNLALGFSTAAAAAVSVTYTIAQPAIDLEKATNGEDADLLPGPILYPGDVVTWTYVVTNIGEVPLVDLSLVDDREGDIIANCPKDHLATAESMLCSLSGIAQQGAYTNMATVIGNVPGSLPGEPRKVTDTDPSHYYAVGDPAIDLEKWTNGEDADTLPGPLVAAGDLVTWSYLVHNVGEIDLEAIQLFDDREGDLTANCPQSTLAVDEQMICTVTGVAQQGQYTNTAVVTGTTPANSVRPNLTVTDEDPSHYLGIGQPAIELEKLTNGEDADILPGPLVTAGAPITWSYIVRNIGALALESITLVDDREGDVTVYCPQTILAVGESMRCSVTGIAQLGQYTNTAVVTGTTTADMATPATVVRDTDPSHYFGTQIAVCPVDATGAAILPALRYLGEGPGEYRLADPEEQFILKKFEPFHFTNQWNSPYQSTRLIWPPERVWACTGECSFIRGWDEVIDLGDLPGDITLHVAIIDDDDDERVNTIFADDEITMPLLRITEQTFTEYVSVILPRTARWHIDAADSIGIYFCAVP